MKNIILAAILAIAFNCCYAQGNAQKFAAYPLIVEEKNSLLAKWEKKAVLQSRLIDDMEQEGKWKVTSIGKMSYTRERAKDGKQSLRFSTSMRDDAYLALPANHGALGAQTFNITGQAGASSVILTFDTPQDWSAYNRISFWVYVHPTNMLRQNLNMAIINEGTVSGPLTTARSHYINDLKPGQWNHVIFEMPHLPRNKISSFSIKRELTGFMAGEDSIVTYDIDKLELQRVVTDQYEGWTVAPEKFSFSHAGYRPSDAKIAMVGIGAGNKFTLINQQGNIVFTGNVRSLENKNGSFNQLDFTDFRTAGVYRIRSGSLESNPFPINENIWLDPVFKAVNFYFCERCGYDVPGIHKACHQDWQGVRGDVKKVVNGGYHDAGDLSQGIWRTATATFVMLRNLEVLTQKNTSNAMTAHLRSEIEWGLQYLLNTRFGDGYHIHWCRMRMFTDNIIGTTDDVTIQAQNLPWENFLAAAVECKAAQLFEKSNPALAKQAREAALDDWKSAADSTKSGDRVSIEEASWGATSSLLLAKLTGDDMYKERAAFYGNLIIRCQEQHFVQGIPITGYFYSNTNQRRVIHNKHTAFEEAPMIALAMLCNELPQHENWIDWYSSAVLYSDFFMKRGSQIAAPYNMLPNSVWSKTEIMEDRDEQRRAVGLQQFNEGTKLNDEYSLRTFPIWTDATFHGSTNVQLSGTWALAEAARLRNDAEGMKLAGKQLEWVLGANPFGQSLMYGEGYDFQPLFAYCLRGFVGALPVGMDSRAGDAPYWPATNSATYKEMWMEPVNRFLGAVSVYNSRNQSVIPKQEAGKNITIQTETSQSDKGLVSVIITVKGNGKHEIDIKPFNAKGSIASKQILLSGNKSEKIQLELNVTDQTKPYIAVITADNNPMLRKEIIGSYNTATVLAKK